VYNLFVSGNGEAWDGEPFILELGRCVREYTDKELSEKYGEFTQEQIEAIRRLPCIFAYEAGWEKDPKFGIVRQITKRQGKVKIEYDLVELDKFITHADILDMVFELDISD
jgi:hypothetical protein